MDWTQDDYQTLEELTMRELTKGLEAEVARLRSIPECDFCAGEALWVYAGRLDGWRWCACARCSQAVERSDWKAVKRSVRGRLERAVALAGLGPWTAAQMHAAIRDNVKEFRRSATRPRERLAANA